MVFAAGVIGIVLMLVLISGCMENAQNKEVNDTTDYKSIVKHILHNFTDCVFSNL
ncbi:exported hypothetical protein [groundwater metagenome]|uniref:Uncharacterized protein n=1 Tax=groundwater metagenome TaxID=717931 RepID=A0A098EE90_9ZZZZ